MATLDEHSHGVAGYARRFASACGLEADTLAMGGLVHDLGKLDPRFQRLLKGVLGGAPLAKSASFSPDDRFARQYPMGARHELLSAAMVSTKTSDDLLLYLIATHHGAARPFADPVEEDGTAKSPFAATALGVEYKLASCAQEIAQWNASLAERFWRIVRKYGWWGAAYREAIFRLADHAQSREEQERERPSPAKGNSGIHPFIPLTVPCHSHLTLSGLDGANPLAFLAAVGTLVVCDRLSRSQNHCPRWLAGTIGLSWGTKDSPNTPILHLPAQPPSQSEFAEFLATHLPTQPADHPASYAVRLLTEEEQPRLELIRALCDDHSQSDRASLDWVTALLCETAPDAASQLQTIRRDYLIGNLRSVMERTTALHLQRSLFSLWDFADALDNQSLHWEPTEDRRHAYQWHMPSGDPTRKLRGGMLGANRLALEAWPLFPSFSRGERLATRGFRGTSRDDTYWTWPLWCPVLTVDGVASILGLPLLQDEVPDGKSLRAFGISAAFRSQRILVSNQPRPKDVALGRPARAGRHVR